MKFSVFCSDNDNFSVQYNIKVQSCEDKKKQVKILHKEFLEEYPQKKILEVSTRSSVPIGQQLSAFNLKYFHPKRNKYISVESAYQASKVFENGDRYSELYDADPYTAKMDKRLWGREVIGYKFHSQDFSIDPPTFFYNWLYLKTLQQNRHLLNEMIKYDSFTDTAAASRSVNCQARACAIAISLLDKGLFYDALKSLHDFKEIVYNSYIEEPIIEITKEQEQYLLFEFG